MAADMAKSFTIISAASNKAGSSFDARSCKSLKICGLGGMIKFLFISYNTCSVITIIKVGSLYTENVIYTFTRDLIIEGV